MLQVPSNLILLRVGAPIWLGITVVGWGTVAALFATVKNTRQFYVLRFLLGITECGAFPGTNPHPWLLRLLKKTHARAGSPDHTDHGLVNWSDDLESSSYVRNNKTGCQSLDVYTCGSLQAFGII